MIDEVATEEKAPSKKVWPWEKLTLIFAAGALLLSLTNTVLIALNPSADKVEAFNKSLEKDLAESIATLHKKIDGLKTAEAEWQMVLKNAQERPDAVYKVSNTQDGFLTLMEIQVPVAPPAAAATAAPSEEGS